jgi:hypothetical protein
MNSHTTFQMNVDNQTQAKSEDLKVREAADAVNGAIKLVDNANNAVSLTKGLGGVAVGGGVAAAGGAGMMQGLAAVGGVVGGGAVAGIGVLGAAPIAAVNMAMDRVLADDARLSTQERDARAVGRTMTKVGAVAGAAGTVGTLSAAGVAGLSSAGITSGLAAIGGTVGGGMGAGIAITVAAPAVVAAGVGYGAYKIWQWLTD